MKPISRKLALQAFSIKEITETSTEDIEQVLSSDYIDSSGKPIKYLSIYESEPQGFLIDHYVTTLYSNLSNKFLEQFLHSIFGAHYKIIGSEPTLFSCPCCLHLTLRKLGSYDICTLCHWEDDGKTSDRQDEFSSVNNSTIRDYRTSNIGVINKNSGRYCQPK